MGYGDSDKKENHARSVDALVSIKRVLCVDFRVIAGAALAPADDRKAP
jgi:hypothetical protein